MNAQQTAKAIQNKISLVQREIQTKESDVSELKERNAELIEKNLGLKRKSKALDVQRQTIQKANAEIEELKIVEQSLAKKLDIANSDAKQEQLKNQIANCHELSKEELRDVETCRRNIVALEKSLMKLDKVGSDQGALYNIYSLLFNNAEAMQFIDLPEILQKWSASNINLVIPLNVETRLAKFNNTVFGRCTQLQALFNGTPIPSMPSPKSSLTNNQPLTKSEVREQQAGLDATKRAEDAKKNTSRYVDAHNPNYVRHIPDRNPNVGA